MKTIRFLVLLLLTTVVFAALPARADTYSWSNLQSDIAGAALHTDRDLVNSWGMAASSGGTIWVADNGTGVVFNSTSFFKVKKDGNSQPARFIFVSEDGIISGWNPTLDGTHAIVAV